MSIRASAVLLFVAAALAACSGSSRSTTQPWVQPADAGSRRDAGAGRMDAALPDPARVMDAASGLDAGQQAAANGSSVMTPEQLRDPESCKGCHPSHYREWSSSMHAYSAIDPVFIAMNQRGQRETGGALGDFCVKCHAPMAVADGLTRDGLNLHELPDQKRGVSCYFCHNVVSIDADHNGKLSIARDDVMRGPIADPAESGAHRSAFTDAFNFTKPERNAMCGGCHDIVTPNGVAMERTYKEFLGGLYGQRPAPEAPTLESCVGCHMPFRRDVVATAPPGLPMRDVHEHLWPGIDVALTDFPNKKAMRSAVEDCQLGQASVAFFTLDVTPPNVFTFKVETNAGHNQPSGAAQDRRMWLEVSAFDADGKLIQSSSSGIIGDQELEERPLDDPRHDPRLWMFRDRIFDDRGEPTHMFWEAAASQAHPTGYESNTLEVRKETLGLGTHFVEKAYRLPGASGAATPARVSARLRIRPIGMDVLQDLVESGDLEASVLGQMPTFSFRAQLAWTEADGFMNPISARATPDCESYRCMLDPEAKGCAQ